MMMRTASDEKKMVLIVDSNLSRASAMHASFVEAGYKTVVARDLPTALLMMSQHFFSAAVMSSSISEEGDGWSVAAVFRMVFPNAYVAVVARERSVSSLQAAINHGADELFETDDEPRHVAKAVTSALKGSSAGSIH